LKGNIAQAVCIAKVYYFAVQTISVALVYFLQKLARETSVLVVVIAVVVFFVALLQTNVANPLSQLVELLLQSGMVLVICRYLSISANVKGGAP